MQKISYKKRMSFLGQESERAQSFTKPIINIDEEISQQNVELETLEVEEKKELNRKINWSIKNHGTIENSESKNGNWEILAEEKELNAELGLNKEVNWGEGEGI